MTDIRRQIVPMIKLLTDALGSIDSTRLTSDERTLIIAQIRDLLPESYGIGAGCIIDGRGHQSASFDVILYDRPLANGAYESQSAQFRLEHVLGVVCFEKQHTLASLRDTLNAIASLKALRGSREANHLPEPSRSPGLFGAKIPKWRLPAVLVICWDLQERFNTDESLFMALRSTLHHPPSLQPEYLYIASSNIGFRNPLLDVLNPPDHLTGLSRLPDLHRPGNCYVCSTDFHRRHFFYDSLCQSCGDLNYAKRYQSADLRGRIALVTGARIKIGYAAALKLLRAGAQVITTTRFPHDAVRRFANEPDFAKWSDHLHIYGLDFRHLPGVQGFIRHLYETYPKLDILINNAAQTVRRPPAYYAHLMAGERTPRTALPAELQRVLPSTNGTSHALTTGQIHTLLPISQQGSSAEFSQVAVLPEDSQINEGQFPLGEYDADGQQVDRRESNSWSMHLSEVSLSEMMEVHLVNVMTPTMLINDLRDLMLRSEFADRYIINVSAAEGQFAQVKQGSHPHTNMAKAALNMLTHTIAAQYAEQGIYVNAVDPGWVSHQAPSPSPEHDKRRADLLPIDLLDAAARLCDPIFMGVHCNQHPYGFFFKDYQRAAW